MPYATSSNGIKLHYVVDDFTDSWRDAPWIVLQHGFGRNTSFWYKWVPMLAGHFRVLRLDMRGFGKSREGFAIEQGFALDDLANDVVRVLDHAGIASAHFVGEAFGGTLGMQVASQYPDRIRTLNLLSAPVILLPKLHNTFALGEASWGDFLAKYGAKKWAEQTNSLSRFPTSVPQGFLDWYSEGMGQTDGPTLARFTQLCQQYDQTRFLAGITAPVLGVYSNSREEQVELLRANVKKLSVVHIDTACFMIYLAFPRLHQVAEKISFQMIS